MSTNQTKDGSVDNLSLGVWKKRDNCYKLDHYDLVFKRDLDKDHGVLFQPDECSIKDTMLCPKLFYDQAKDHLDMMKQMKMIVKTARRDMIKQGLLERDSDLDDSENEASENENIYKAGPSSMPLPPTKTPKKQRSSRLTRQNKENNEEDLLPGMFVTDVSPTRESFSVQIQDAIVRSNNFMSSTKGRIKRAVKTKKSKKQKQKNVQEKLGTTVIAEAQQVDVEMELGSPSARVAQLVDYHEKEIVNATSTPAVKAIPSSSSNNKKGESTTRRKLEDEMKMDQINEEEENVEEALATPVNEIPLTKDEIIEKIKSTRLSVDLTKNNVLYDHEESMIVDREDESSQYESDQEEELQSTAPSTARSSTSSRKRLSGYANSKKMSLERSRAKRMSAQAAAQLLLQKINESEDEDDDYETARSSVPDDAEEEEEVQVKTATITLVKAPRCTAAARKKTKRKPPVTASSRKFASKKPTSSFGSTTERFGQMTPLKNATPRQRACLTPASSSKPRSTLSFLNRSTGASRLRRQGAAKPTPLKQPGSATPSTTPMKNRAHVIQSFVNRNTPEKVLQQVDVDERKRQLEEKNRAEMERKARQDEEKRRQIAETKRKRDERFRKCNEKREINDQKRAEEIKLKNMKEQEKKARLEAKKKDDAEKKKTVAEKAEKMKRKLQEEQKDTKRQKVSDENDNDKEKKVADKQLKKKQREEERVRKAEAVREKAEKARLEKEARVQARDRAREEQLQLVKKQQEERRRLMEESRKRQAEAEARRKREEEMRRRQEEEERKRREADVLLKQKQKEEIALKRKEAQKRKEEEMARQKQMAEEEEKRRLEEEELEREREKEEALQKAAAMSTPKNVKKPTAIASNPALNETYNMDVSQYNMTPSGADKLRLPSSKDDYNINDLDSGDSTDEEDNPRKIVPSWAKGLAFKQAMRRQCVTNPPDINQEFPHARYRSVDLQVLFNKRLERYNKRTSSACWSSPPARGPGHVSFNLK